VESGGSAARRFDAVSVWADTRGMATDELDILTPAGQRWVARSQRPLDMLAVVFLVDFVLIWAFPEGPDGFLRVLDVIAWVVWAAFAVDYVVRWSLALRKAGFVRTHKLDLLMVLLPMLRLLRIFLLLRRALANVSTEKIAGSIVSIVVAVVFTSAFFMWRVEYDAPGATITTFRKAVWWAIVTTTTVGYGDYTPVSAVGRGIAVLVMIVGIGLIGTVSATVAAWFVTRPAEGAPLNDQAPPVVGEQVATSAVSESVLVAKLDALAAQQEEIRHLLVELRLTPGDSSP
jgi:voltage-gated potassium channel